MSEIHQYEIHWKGWNEGARMPSHGSTKEYGQTPEEATRRVCERYPRISEILEIRQID